MTDQQNDTNPIKTFIEKRLPLIVGAFLLLALGITSGDLIPEGSLLNENNDDDSSSTVPDEEKIEIIYLGPADTDANNLFLTEINSGDTRQLTDVPYGIDTRNRYAFDISNDTSKIAYARKATETANNYDIWVLDLETNEHFQVTNCADANASCYTPQWHPTDNFIGYTREEFNPDVNRRNRLRAWLVDINSLESSLVFSDESVIGSLPRWSPDAKQVAILSSDPLGITIYNYEQDEFNHIATLQNSPGIFAPDGEFFIYSVLAQGVAGALTYPQFELFNFETEVTIPISGGSQRPVEDIQGDLNSDGTELLVVRRYLDDRYTDGGQLYIIDLETGQLEELLVNANYIHGAIDWQGTDENVVFQRFDYATTALDIFMINVETKELDLVVPNALLPRFLD